MDTIEFVDLFNPCAGGMRMPNNIWMRVDELPMSPIGWAMSSGLMDGEKSRQTDLTMDWEAEGQRGHPQGHLRCQASEQGVLIR